MTDTKPAAAGTIVERLRDVADLWAAEGSQDYGLLNEAASTIETMRDALELVRMSNGWRYLAPETQQIVDAALSAARGGE